MKYWLIKSEPNVYSIEHLQKDGKTIWDGVRNYQARNFLTQMQEGDLCFFYHSNIVTPGIVGLARIIKSNEIDPTQFDFNSPYYDPRSTFDAPRWRTVKIEFVAAYPQIISLDLLKKTFTSEELMVVRRGNRLSVMPVENSIAKKLLGAIATRESV